MVIAHLGESSAAQVTESCLTCSSVEDDMVDVVREVLGD